MIHDINTDLNKTKQVLNKESVSELLQAVTLTSPDQIVEPARWRLQTLSQKSVPRNVSTGSAELLLLLLLLLLFQLLLLSELLFLLLQQSELLLPEQVTPGVDTTDGLLLLHLALATHAVLHQLHFLKAATMQIKWDKKCRYLLLSTDRCGCWVEEDSLTRLLGNHSALFFRNKVWNAAKQNVKTLLQHPPHMTDLTVTFLHSVVGSMLQVSSGTWTPFSTTFSKHSGSPSTTCITI